MDTEYKITIKDIILTGVFIVIVVWNVINYIFHNGMENLGGLIEQTLLIMLSFVTLADIASYTNWSILVPDFFVYAKERKQKEREQIEILNARNSIQKFIDKDLELFLNDYNQEKMSFILSNLGISADQLDQIRIELIKMRCLPLKDLEDAKSKIKRLVKSAYPIIIDQEKFDSSKICYKKVRYYVNIMDIMFIPDYANELSAILAYLIQEKIKPTEIDKLIIPHDSNFLLGVEVGKKLGKTVVKMRAKGGKIESEKYWDGNLEPTDRVIIVHDVLVSGEQISDALGHLPKPCQVKGFFCLITRKEWQGKRKLTEKRIPCYEILELDDKDIHELRNEGENQ